MKATEIVIVELKKNIALEADHIVEHEEEAIIGDDQGGEYPFVDTEEIDSPFIIKRQKSSSRGTQKKKKLDKCVDAKMMVLTEGDINEIRHSLSCDRGLVGKH